MKPFRLLALLGAACAVLAGIAVAIAFSTSFQTWAARRAIASRPGLRATLGSVSAGMKRVEFRNLRFEEDGAVLTLPAVAIDLPMATAGWSRKIFVTRLVATGWTLDLTRSPGARDATTAAPPSGTTPAPTARPAPTPQTVTTPPPAPTIPPATPVSASSIPAAAPAAVARAFAGVFTQLELPVDVSLDGVQLEGDVLLPESRGRAKVTITGGGLSAGHEGKFDLRAAVALTGRDVQTVEFHGAVGARMDTPRSFTKLALTLEAAAKGERFPGGVDLRVELAAARAAAGENYSGAVVAAQRRIAALDAEFPRGASRLDGRWKLELSDADLAPFALGQPLPAFTAAGEGKFDADATFATLHALGGIKASVDKLQVFRPELAALGELHVTADFDLAERNGTIGVQSLEATLAAASPVATFRVLQPFEFNPASGELRTPDPARDLLGITLQGVPVAWARPFCPGLDVAGGQFRGEIAATARAGGVTVHSTAPLTVDGVDVAHEGRPLLKAVRLALNTSAGYTPQGWQAEISGFTAKSGEATLLTLDAKAGRFAGRDQPIKATGRLTGSLPALLAQPAAAGTASLTSGEAAVDFVVSLNSKQELQATVNLKDLATVVDTKAVKLPALSTSLRADLAADGTIAFNAPIVLERNERKSDLTVIGTIAPEKDKRRAIDAEVTSRQLFVDDAQLLGSLFPARPDSAAPAPSGPAAAPPWSTIHGSLALQLDKVVYSDALQASNVTGRVRIDEGMLKLEGLQAGMGEGGRANLDGSVTFDASDPRPYTLVADVALKEFDPGPLFRAFGGERPATIEGRFDVTSTLASRAVTLGALAEAAGGNFQVTSKGGVFRGLPVNVSNIVENTSRLGALIASAGTAISAMTGRKDYAEVANKAEAVAELARGLNPIQYDQLSVLVSRDAELNTTLRDFTLISPELRLTGSGTAQHTSGMSPLDDALAMEFKLRARGRQGELLKYLGAIEPQTDDLGYAACTVPLKVGGTLGQPDTSELNGRLTALAIEKSGFGDRAAEFINRIRGAK